MNPRNWKFAYTLAAVAFLLVAGTIACAPQEEAADATAPAETGEADGTAEMQEAKPAAWSYAGETGPAAWGGLSDEYAACDGRRQSPVDVTAMAAVDLPDLAPDYGAADLRWFNAGKTLQAEVSGGHSLTVGDDTWNLVQFHFHTPSEHTIDGTSYPMTVHFVHARGEGLTDLAVLGLMFEEAEADNPALAPLLAQVPANPGDSMDVAGFDLAALLPADLTDYRYPGSLTTPPCSEVVSWHVVAQPVPASLAQIAAMREVMGANARPLQELYDRTIEKDAS